MITSLVVPAVIPKSYDDLVKQINLIKGVPEIHIDVVDGVFAPAITWPYIDSDQVINAKALLSIFSLEVDLMVENPVRAAEDWIKAGADQLVFHIESISPNALTDFVLQHDVTIGVGISILTPVKQLIDYLVVADYIQVMGIENIGYQSQPFTDKALSKIREIKDLFPNMPISIDGSVNAKTVPILTPYKLNRFIMGSAIMGAESPKEAYKIFSKRVIELTS